MLHFTLTAIIIFGNFPLFLTKRDVENHQYFHDTPSPEWIKYQQERYDPRYNKNTLSPAASRDHQLRNNLKNHASSAIHKMDFMEDVQNKIETSSRQNSANNHRHDDTHEEEVYVDEDNQDDDQQQFAKGEAKDESNTNNLKYPSIQGFLEFVKSLRQTWIKKSLFSIEDKIKFLYNLKNSLMRTIEQQYTNLWPDAADDESDDDIAKSENEGRHLRPKRGILDASSINFPPEAALMSINFLTFAVFLIKLVLQVVNIIRSKHVQFSSFGFNTDSLTKG